MSGVLCLLFAALFTTPVAEKPDEPIANVPLPADWKLFPFVETEPAPDFSSTEMSRGFLVYSRPITAPIFRKTNPRAEERIESLAAFAAQGERAQFSFAVQAASNLTSLAATASLPFDGEIRQITYSPNRLSRYTDVGQARERPAYLVPAAFTALARGENLRYVLTVRVPTDAVPGDYAGEVELKHAGLAKPLRLPLALTVLPFRLSRDPSKTYTAYAGKRYDLKRMAEYGFTTLPTIYIDYDTAADRMEVRNLDDRLAEWRSYGGSNPTRLIALMNVNAMLYRKYMGKMPVKRPQTDMPPDAFFEHLERLGRAFLADWNARGLPRLYVIGADEPEASNMPYVKRLYQALKAAGFSTYVTSWTDNHDAYSPIDPYVDVYCEQLHQSADRLAASGKREHWCYPNHNAFELKEAALQSRGGRMTWGFGFWRSADSVLIPWAWSWKMDYTKIPGLSIGGQRLKDDGTEWIEWEWESFVAGAIDEAYVYTLEEAVFRREGASAPAELVRAIAEARALLASLRAATPFRQRYLAENHWPDADFDAARMKLADAILSLKRFPENNDRVCPSVLPGIPDSGEDAAVDLSSKELKPLLCRREIPAEKAYPIEPGVKVKCLPDGSVSCDISIDREHGSVNGYLCTTPSLGFKLDPKVDLSQYGYMTYSLRVRSNRDADHAGFWPYQILVSAKSDDGRNLNAAVDTSPSLPPDVWHAFTFPLSEVNLPSDARSRAHGFRFYFKERDYATGDELHLDVKDVAFVGARLPVLTRFAASPVRRGERRFACETSLFSLPPGGRAKARLSVSDSSGRCVSVTSVALSREVERRFIPLDSPLAPGCYSVRIDLIDGEKAYQSKTADLIAVRF